MLLALALCPTCAQAQGVMDDATCATAGATRFGLPPLLVLAVREVEGGVPGKVSPNTNGTYDIGPMQINSIHLPLIEAAGISEQSLRDDACLNIQVGAWMLRHEIDGAPDVWTGIGRYHSRTESLNTQYQVRVWRRLEWITVHRLRLADTLEE